MAPRFELNVQGVEDNGWRLISAQYPSRCLACREGVEQGERVWWRTGEGVRHEVCGAPLPDDARGMCRACMMFVTERLLADGLCPGCR